ncbi:hypothetical protein [Streptomyces sp. MST-110588]|uniref:hypothetical protein n=1 Tax=Streptomyces sp. MST-110588 TaxID=2833628 RepID=UPI001F5C58A4|nr:hypothetical protein [Streptomyces sp. MST-110588]UNO40240.1 hypothetical protein KGS77_12445 [Streptomyces sp. MST-110588]
MKQGTIKTLGAAALGIAFAAAAAGPACADAAALGSAPGSGSVGGLKLPIDKAAKSITGKVSKGDRVAEGDNKPGDLLGGLPPGLVNKSLQVKR